MLVVTIFSHSLRFAAHGAVSVAGKLMLGNIVLFLLVPSAAPFALSAHTSTPPYLLPRPRHHLTKKSVVVVDTRNEVGGDGVIPHRGAIGEETRRLMVPPDAYQHE